MKRPIFFTIFLLGLVAPASAAPLKVVTTLSTFADLVKTIGGEQVEVSYIAPPKFNPHFIEPRPSDVLKVKKADLFVHAGLDLELWRWPLVEAAGNREGMPGGSRELDFSRGVKLLEVPQGSVSRAEGDIHLYGNPHYWLDPRNGKIMAQTIAEKLSELDPEHISFYNERMRVFTRQLDQRITEWESRTASILDRELVAYHNSWPYLAAFAVLTIEQFLEPKPGIPPSPKQIEFIERHIREQKIRAIVQESYFPRETAETVAKRTRIKVVLLYQNVGQAPEASDYLSMMEYNLSALVSALGGNR